MARTIPLQSDSNAHDRPWRVAVEQGFFAEEGLDVVYHEDNPKGAEGRVKDFAQRWKETQLRASTNGARVYRFPFRRVNGRRSSISLRGQGLRAAS